MVIKSTKFEHTTVLLPLSTALYKLTNGQFASHDMKRAQHQLILIAFNSPLAAFYGEASH